MSAESRRAGFPRVYENVSPVTPNTVPDNADVLVDTERHRREAQEDERREYKRLWAAFMLSPKIGVAEALLLGEAVPEEALDPVWLARLGRLGHL